MTEHWSVFLLSSPNRNWTDGKEPWTSAQTRLCARGDLCSCLDDSLEQHLSWLTFVCWGCKLQSSEKKKKKGWCTLITADKLPFSSMLLHDLQKGKAENPFHTALISENGRIHSHAFYMMGRSQLFGQMQLQQKPNTNERAQYSSSRCSFQQERWTFKSYIPFQAQIHTSPLKQRQLHFHIHCSFSEPKWSDSSSRKRTNLHRREQWEIPG